MTTYLAFLTYPVDGDKDDTDSFLVKAESMEDAGEKIVEYAHIDAEKIPVTLYDLAELDPITQI